MTNDIIIGMAGSGGDGIVSAGDALITAAALEGYNALLTKSFGPQIRGGVDLSFGGVDDSMFRHVALRPAQRRHQLAAGHRLIVRSVP